MDATDLLDMAEAEILHPLLDHPEQFDKFRRETLYAPLEGTFERRRAAQEKLVGQFFGMKLDDVPRMIKQQKEATT